MTILDRVWLCIWTSLILVCIFLGAPRIVALIAIVVLFALTYVFGHLLWRARAQLAEARAEIQEQRDRLRFNISFTEKPLMRRALRVLDANGFYLKDQTMDDAIFALDRDIFLEHIPVSQKDA